MKLKPGVCLDGSQAKLLEGLAALDALFSAHDLELVVTAGQDGKHMAGSKHYVGLAVDIRFPLRDEIRAALGPGWDVVWEKDHVHLEWDPK